MLLLAKVPAVIGPQHDDGVAGLAAFLERGKHTTDLLVGERARSEIPVHRLAPLVVPEHFCVVALRSGHLHAGGWDVVEIIVRHVGQGQFFCIEQVIVFLRNIPRQMRLVDTAGEEERLVVLAAKLADHPVGYLVVAHFFVCHIERPPVEVRRFWDTIYWPLCRQGVVRFVFRRAGPVAVPRRRIGKPPVINFARASGPVTVFHEVLRQRHGVRQGGAPRLAVQVHAGG